MPQRGCRLKLIHWRYEWSRAAPGRRGIGGTRGLCSQAISYTSIFQLRVTLPLLLLVRLPPSRQLRRGRSGSLSFFADISERPPFGSPVHGASSQATAYVPARLLLHRNPGACERPGVLPRPTEIALRRGAPDGQQAFWRPVTRMDV
jgi:hypothetical protein